MSKKNTYYGSRKSYRFLLDEYPNAEIAYSVYKLDSAYAGNCAQIVQTGTANLDNFGFGSDNFLDTAAIDSFFTLTAFSPNADLNIWRDQSGNLRDVQAPGSGNRPNIKNLTAGYRELNGQVAPLYDGTDDRLTSGSNFIFRNTGHGLVAMVLNRGTNLASEALGFQVVTSASNSRAFLLYRSASGGATNEGLSAGGRRLAANAVQSVGTSAYSADQIIVIAHYEWANARLRIYENGVLTGDRVFQTAGLTENNAGTFFLGATIVGTIPLNGHIQECVAWQGANAEAHAADIAGITSNINSRFNTF
jgi:hypothetical protein